MEPGKKLRLWSSLPSLSKAASELRSTATIAQLEASEACTREEWKDIEAFYERLNTLENSQDDSTQYYKPIIVSVELAGKGAGFLEGLGCGEPQKGQPFDRVMRTPPASLSVAKDIFQKLGGVAARAFEVLANYMAVQECKDLCKEERQPLVFLSEGFCRSAFCSGMDDEVCWRWPPALMKPTLVLVQEAGASPRLMNALQQLDVEKISVEMDGLSRLEILEVVKGKISKAIFPSTEDLKLMLGNNPLRCLVSVARKEGLLAEEQETVKWQLGRRGKHIPWKFQLATPSRRSDAPPALRNLGIHAITETGFVFFCLGSPGGGSGQEGDDVPASMVLLLCSYPFEQQWRGEGVVKKMKWGGPAPPYSLACAMQRCVEIEQRERVSTGQRVELADQGAVLERQASDTRCGPSTPYIFIPYRMEVLIGHPPAPGGTRRCEWFRRSDRLWEASRALLPFSPSPLDMFAPSSKREKLTVVIMGSHTAGKSTVGAELARRLQWQWDSELGTSLRGAQEEMGKYGEDWDESIHKAEVARDQERMSSKTSRVVETWHLGNYVWALTRHPEQEQELYRRALRAILEEQEATRVLLVLLQIDASTMLRRRKSFRTSALHFKEEEIECLELSKATGEKLEEILQEPKQLDGIPLFKLNNNADGQLEETIDTITDFISFFI